MKISQEVQRQIDAATQQQKNDHNKQAKFNRIVQTEAQKVKQQGLERLMDSIARQGDKLVRFRSFRDFAKFKRMVKQLLKETAGKGLKMSNQHHFSLDGRSQQFHIVKEVDRKLLQLADDLLNDERQAVDLLGLIGEIKGLLINLYQ